MLISSLEEGPKSIAKLDGAMVDFSPLDPPLAGENTKDSLNPNL